jgi:hypothetical protein
MKITPGETLTIFEAPCQAPGTVFPGLIRSVDTTLILQNGYFQDCMSGFFFVIEPVRNPPVNPSSLAPTRPSESVTPPNTYSAVSSSYSFVPSYIPRG